jgi:hypothetical protein
VLSLYPLTFSGMYETLRIDNFTASDDEKQVCVCVVCVFTPVPILTYTIENSRCSRIHLRHQPIPVEPSADPGAETRLLHRRHQRKVQTNCHAQIHEIVQRQRAA